MQKLIPIQDLILNAGTQIRVKLEEHVIEDYADLYRRKVKMPPIHTFHDGGKYIVADGFHRAEGAQRAGCDHILSEVHPGNKDKALLFALGANGSHGLRRTNEDKRNAVNIALRKWPRKTNREIADICSVSHTLVNDLRPSTETTAEDLEAPSTSQSQSSGGTPAPAPAPKVRKTKPAEPAPAPAPVAKDAEFDVMGYPLPKEIVPLFNRRNEIQELVDHLSEVKKKLSEVMNCGGDPLYAHLTLTALIPDVEVLIYTLKTGMPSIVCPYCQGLNLTQCTLCRHTGLIGKFTFERQIPTEHQAMRKAQIEQIKEAKKK